MTFPVHRQRSRVPRAVRIAAVSAVAWPLARRGTALPYGTRVRIGSWYVESTSAALTIMGYPSNGGYGVGEGAWMNRAGITLYDETTASGRRYR
jgi:hypothetical protein